MQTSLAATIALIIGVGLGFVIPRNSGTRNGLKNISYFDVRSTATMIDEQDPVRNDRPIRRCGSEEIAFVEGDSTVRVYLISKGKRKLLHDLNVKPEWFRSIWFTAFERQSGSVGLVLTARSLLNSADEKVIPDGYGKYPSMFDRHWEYDLGKIASITTTCNEHVTTNPQWKPGIETPALSYQFSRDKVDFRPLAMKGSILFSAMSEQAMIEASSREQNVGFILVTVEVHTK